MAIYHLSVKTVSRAKGRSATAAAAYRAGVEIADERTGEVHDYSRKSGVAHAEIILPRGADPRFEDRSVLWNAVEKSEKRKNSTVAREYEVALPAELSPDQRRALATAYGHWLAERFGVGVDVCIHEPNREGDQRNHHAHILTTTRKIEGGELTGKTRELDERKSGAIEEVRTVWEDLANRHLDRAQEQARIDRRSFERQGREAAPSIHLGPAATAKERRGEETERGNLNRLVAGINRQFEAARTYLAEVMQTVRDLAQRDRIEAELDRRRQLRQGQHVNKRPTQPDLKREGDQRAQIEAELARRRALRKQEVGKKAEPQKKAAPEPQKNTKKSRSNGWGMGM